LANSKENFIVNNRNDSIKFQLANILNFKPINYSEYKTKLANKDLDFSLINFTENLASDKVEQNFLTTLKSIDEAYKSNSSNKDYMFIQNPNEARYLSYQGKSAIMAGIDLSALGYDELYCKTLAKSGAKIGFIGKGAPFTKEGSEKNKIIVNLQDAGMVLILNNLPQDELLNVLKQAEKPVGVVSNNLDVLNDEIIQKMKSKGSVFIYEFSPENNLEEVLNNLASVRSKLGSDLVTFSLSEFNNKTYAKMKDLYLSMDKNKYDSDLLNKIFSNNMITLITKGLQERQQRTGGRPF
jgi:hypothetical protein